MVTASEAVLIPAAAPGSGGRGVPDGAGDPLARVCQACGTSAPPDDTFCTNCGRALPPLGGRTSSRRRRSAGDGPAWRRLPVWIYGVVGLVVVVVVVSAAALVLYKPTGLTPPIPTPVVSFAGDGYSLNLPAAYGWVYLKADDGDQWHVQPLGSPGKGIEVTLVGDLTSAEQTLEGALGRMESGLPTARRPVIGTPQGITVGAGRAYRVVDSGGIDTYVFYQGGRAIFLAFHNVARSDEDAVAASVTLK